MSGDISTTVKSGKVVLVGAGPGAPDLITVRGLKALQQADVVLYDRLVSRELLDETASDCRTVYVGKKPGAHGDLQEQIERQLIEEARAGHRVVRLKGGDPFLFGRGADEMLACLEAGIPCEVIPGVSSALAAPAAAGIPLTHRGLATTFGVVPGHLADDSEALDWASLARLDTLVVLMGVGKLQQIVEALIAAGRGPETPAAVIQQATYESQKIVTATLSSLVDRVVVAGIEAPAVVVIGAVAALAELAERPVAPPSVDSLTAWIDPTAVDPDVAVALSHALDWSSKLALE